MLHQELPSIESAALGGWGRWIAPALIVAGSITIAVLLLIAGKPLVAAALVVLAAVAAAILFYQQPQPSRPSEPLVVGPDYALLGSALGLSTDPVALTTGEGSLLLVNAAFRERFGGARPPLELAADDDAAEGLKLAQTMAWRDGGGCVAAVETIAGATPVEVERIGTADNLLLWRFVRPGLPDPVAMAANRLRGRAGELLGRAGVLAAFVDPQGKLLAWNLLFGERALAGQGGDEPRLSDLVRETEEEGHFQLIAEGENGRRLRAVMVPLDPPGSSDYGNFYLFDSPDTLPMSSSSHLQTLLDMLPIGLALVDGDGRFLTMNEAFCQAAGITSSARPVYPGDLVVKEDKAAVADAVRRNARGPAMSGDVAVRLARQPTEPVALTIAGLRGLGDAAVLLLLKDNSEEAKLKRQVAQATKMQVVGQLAGGVAHDFNNILTAIIGHCDLMLMRHTPGDIDYDDIQQIKSNSNRAAGLTRQLLAFPTSLVVKNGSKIFPSTPGAMPVPVSVTESAL
jgi:two-component system cell cycle sensor histidine kinase/response regulator CckA